VAGGILFSCITVRNFVALGAATLATGISNRKEKLCFICCIVLWELLQVETAEFFLKPVDEEMKQTNIIWLSGNFLKQIFTHSIRRNPTDACSFAKFGRNKGTFLLRM
jgi:hypothetical protein